MHHDRAKEETEHVDRRIVQGEYDSARWSGEEKEMTGVWKSMSKALWEEMAFIVGKVREPWLVG